MTHINNLIELKKKSFLGKCFWRCSDGVGYLYLVIGVRLQYRSVFV